VCFIYPGALNFMFGGPIFKCCLPICFFAAQPNTYSPGPHSVRYRHKVFGTALFLFGIPLLFECLELGCTGDVACLGCLLLLDFLQVSIANSIDRNKLESEQREAEDKLRRREVGGLHSNSVFQWISVPA
jgi:hypothetical protein